MTLAPLPGHVAGPRLRATYSPAAATDRGLLLRWFAGGAVLSFAVSWLAADVLELHHDLYLLVYFTVVGVFLASFLAHTWIQMRDLLANNLWWGFAAGGCMPANSRPAGSPGTPARTS